MADKLTAETLTAPKTFGAILTWLNDTFKLIVDFINSYVDKTENEKTVFGVYTGDGTAERTINLGFRPTAVEVYTEKGVQESDGFRYGGLAFDGKPCYSCKDWKGLDGKETPADYKIIEICDNGFKVSYELKGNNTYGNVHSLTNENNTIYYFTAYKNGEIMNIT